MRSRTNEVLRDARSSVRMIRLPFQKTARCVVGLQRPRKMVLAAERAIEFDRRQFIPGRVWTTVSPRTVKGHFEIDTVASSSAVTWDAEFDVTAPLGTSISP